MRAGAARQGVVAVLEDGLRHLPTPLDRAVQALISEIEIRVRVGLMAHYPHPPDLVVEARVVI